MILSCLLVSCVVEGFAFFVLLFAVNLHGILSCFFFFFMNVEK